MKRYLVLIGGLLGTLHFFPQNPLTFNGYIPPGDYKNQQKIVLFPGSLVSAGAGFSDLHIDPSISLNTGYTASGSFGTQPVNYNLDITKPVGTIPYSFEVSPVGSAECSVPVDLPIGTNNMKPSLSFNYSSLLGNGELGSGWSIGGLQKITRQQKTLYHNGVVDKIQLSNSDVFALNGNRLIPTVGTNGANNTIYITEQNNFNRITSGGLVGNGPASFTVETKNGLKLEFGTSANSRLIPQNQTTVFEWRLDKITDVNGNYLTYDYYNANGEILVKSINYSGNVNASIAPYTSIRFYYNFKDDKNKLFVYGGTVSNLSILRQVEIKQGSTFVSQYNFAYTKYFGSSYLTEINYKTRDYSELNSLKFSYQNDSGNPFSQATSGLGAQFYRSKYLFLDFTGDGVKDAVAFDAMVINSPVILSQILQWDNIRALKNNGNSNFSQQAIYSFPANFVANTNYSSLWTKNTLGYSSYASFDFNGDNKEDFYIQSHDMNYDYFKIYISNGSGFNAPINLSVQHVNNPTSIPPQNSYWLTDLNGDSKLDLLYCDAVANNNGQSSGNGQCTFYSILSVENGGVFTVANLFNTPALLNCHNLDPSATKLFDVDGDGKTELIIKGNNIQVPTYSVISLNLNQGLVISPFAFTNAFASIGHPNYKRWTTPVNSYTLTNMVSIELQGDYNGDAKTDVIVSESMPGTGYQYEMYLSKGDGTYDVPILLNKAALGLQDFVQPGYFYFAADMNGDGKTDIVEKNNATTKIYFSKGSNSNDYFFSESYNVSFNAETFDIADVDGNGVNDIIDATWCPNFTPSIIYFYKGGLCRNIKEMVDGFGRKTEVLSAPITDINVYTKNIVASYPMALFTAPIHVVKQVKTPNGIGGFLTETYEYQNAISHKRGKGLLGFTKIFKTNVMTDSKVIDEYAWDPTFFYMKKIRHANVAWYLNQLLNDEVYGTAHYPYYFGSGVSYFSFVNTNTYTDYLQNYTLYNQSSLDANGNTTYTDKNINNGLDHEQTYFNNFVNNGSWMPCRPTSIYKVITRAGQPLVSGTTNYLFDALGQLQSVTEEPGDPKMVVKNFTYDANTGVLLSRTINSPSSGLPVKTTNYVYDSNHRLVTQETNPLNQTLQTKYDYIWAKPLESTGFNGLKTLYTYDALGRITSTKAPDNNITTLTYDWVTPADFTGGDPLGVNNCLYKSFVNAPGSPQKGSYFDMFDREIRTEFTGFNGAKHFKMVQYNAQGLKNVETGLYQLTQNNSFLPIMTTFNYDYLFRLNSATTTDNIIFPAITTSFAYSYNNGNKTTTTTHPDGKVTSETNDPSGLLVSATDNGGNVNYTYWSNRKPKAILVNGTQANYMEYDNFGRQTKLQDKDAGLTLYNYNAYGELASQTDANNKTYNFTYDALGRIVSKTGPDGTYQYQYATGGIAINNLLQETAGNGYYTKYYYDQLSRVNKVEENIAGQNYFTEYVFDQYSRIEKIKYPSGFTTKNVFNGHGHLSQIKNDGNNQAIWTCGGTDPLGEVSSYLSGNAKTTQITRNNFGFPLQHNTPNIQSLTYNYNLFNGNLNSRTDNILGKTESFTYDNLDRLTQSQISGLPNFNVTYNNAGNVLTKTSLGNITYKTSHPDAVNNVDNPNGIITAATIPNSQNIQNSSYTPFNKIQNFYEGSYQYDVFYGCDQERRRANMYNNGSLVYSRTYVGDYEKTVSGGSTSEVHYINSPSGLCGIYVITNGVGAMYYPYEDHLGSITKVTDANGAIIADINYDAWGRRRNNTTWDYTNPSVPPVWLYRGYTGHEHLPELSTINMNGRLYDPILGQMFSPDNFNQNHGYTQNYNRYAYAYNNPLKYTDPNGQWVHILVGAIIGGAINLAVHWDQVMASDHPWRDGLMAFGIGSAGGAIAAATFGAGVAAMTAAGASAYAAVAVAGGVSAVAGDFLTNTGNVLYFNDPMNGPKEYARDFAMGAALAVVGKGVSDGIKNVRTNNIRPEHLEPKGPGQLPIESAEPELRLSSSDPLTSAETPKNLTLNKAPVTDGPFTEFNINTNAEKKFVYDVTNMGRQEYLDKMPGIKPISGSPNSYSLPDGARIQSYDSKIAPGNLPTLQYNNNGFIRYIRFTKP